MDILCYLQKMLYKIVCSASKSSGTGKQMPAFMGKKEKEKPGA